jgi:hypothetical protein
LNFLSFGGIKRVKSDPEGFCTFRCRYGQKRINAEGDFSMPMSKLMEQVIAEVVKLPEKQQDELAKLFSEFIHSDEAEEAEWDALVQSPESQRFLEKMVREVKEEKARGGLLPFPGDDEI